MPPFAFFTFPPLLYLLYRSFYSLLWIPYRTQLHFRRQGVRGPPRRLLSGNAADVRDLIARAQAAPLPAFRHHDVAGRVVPHYREWSARFGRTLVFWFGPQPRLAIAEPELVRAVLTDSTGRFEKVGFNPVAKQLFGDGLPGLKGRKWARHRRVIAPAFNMERVKSWIPAIASSTSTMLEKWEVQGGSSSEFEVEVNKEFHTFTADVISQVAFGSSYKEGKRIFQLQEEQMLLVSLALRTVYIPGFRFIPTKKNRKRWGLNKEIRKSLQKLIQANWNECENSKNLLGLMISAHKNDGEEKMELEEIIDECKAFYFAGKETTANFLTWVILLLALHQDWQKKVRDEVICVCSNHKYPNADDLVNLKIVSMVLKETLRLYPPAVALRRLTTKDTKLGTLDIPAGTQLYMPIIAIHHDAAVWGADADEFNPLRFAGGEGHHLGSFIPFGLGPTICVGQNLAIVEAKVALAMILQRFEFVVSPSYVHAPMLLLTVQPQYGAQVLFRKI
ncbi:cytochrome P450 734A1 [Phoenix dactylifera]|uniref:Cytochrome P450 734A1 n=1 Tax=Phoenix dactylifera TaxID=42345 RepID=A0A8B7CAG2_PHODC|nr:cytochrome P450 734A1 [Phoenix dactylifera]